VSQLLEFDSSLLFQRFLRDHATRWPNWRSMRVWVPARRDVYVLECPAEHSPNVPLGVRVIDSVPASDVSGELRLGDLWMLARPVARDQRPQSTPKCYLLLLEDSDRDIARIVIEAAPAGLELVKLVGTDGWSALAFLVHGDAGRLIAHSPPHGCMGFECDEFPCGGIAALPTGWSTPSLLEELWPTSRESVILYQGSAAGHRVLQATIGERLPLVDLLRADTKPILDLPDPTKGIEKTPWRVIQLEHVEHHAPSDADEREKVNVVYRLRTFDRAHAAPGDFESRRGHALGQPFLQVLDECEAGLLPEIRYAAVDPREDERWHFLCVQGADHRLLESWNSIERFDQIRELIPHNIQAYISTASRMLPPVGAMLGGGSSDSAIVKRIAALLGNPSPDTIVLIEDRAESPGSGSRTDNAVVSKPRIIHINRGKARRLPEVLPMLVRDWNNAEPTQALLDAASANGVAELRNSLESSIRSIGADEDAELRKAADAARQALERWAEDSARAIEHASKPVADAKQVCDELAAALQSGDTTIGLACTALAGFCGKLTNPRRKWITEQTEKSNVALNEAAPRMGEADAVRVAAESMGKQLTEETTRLGNATAALRELEPRMDRLQAEANTALERANATRRDVDDRARATIERIADRRARVQEQHNLAVVRRGQVEAERARLAQQEEALRQYEQRNRELDTQNRAKTTELQNRQREADAQRQELEQIRDSRIPALERETAQAQARLKAMNPEGILARAREAESGLAAATRRITEAEAELGRISNLDAEVRAQREKARQSESEVQSAMASLTAAQGEAASAEKTLSDTRDELQKLADSGGDDALCKKRLNHVKKSLEALENIKAGGFFGGWFGGGR
jgi:hypothetical protein